jgi:hypothetical protein
MATKSFGIKELNLLSSSGTPTLTSSSNLNLTANTVAITGNLTVSGTVNGGSITGGITVQDEGSALSTQATTLNFVGSGVEASGTGATKTITISGGGGGGGVSLINGINNRIITATNSVAVQGEANLTFDGSNLFCNGTINSLLMGIGSNNASTSNIVLGNITTSGSISQDNILIGFQAGQGSSGFSNIALGYQSMTSGSGQSNVAIGRGAGKSGNFNISMGFGASPNLVTGANNNIFMGSSVGTACTGVSYNIAMGYDALNNLDVNSSGGSNGMGHIAIGTSAMHHYKSDFQNLESGGSQNIAIGAFALSEGSGGGSSNIAIGELALGYLNMGINNLNHTAGIRNIAIGEHAGRGGHHGSFNSSNTFTGAHNIFIGWQCASNVQGHTCDDNVIIGTQAAPSLSTGTNNTCIGSGAAGAQFSGVNLTTGSNNLILGHEARSSTATISNEITLGDTNISTLRCNVQTISSLSDARDKTDIVDIPTGLDFLNDLRPVKFKWQTRDGNGKDGSISAGFLAQDLQKTQKESSAEFLNLVMDNNPDRLEAREGQLIPVLVKAIQELSEKNDALEARIKTLEG